MPAWRYKKKMQANNGGLMVLVIDVPSIVGILLFLVFF